MKVDRIYMELKKIREHLIIYDCLFFDRASIKERANIKDIVLALISG